MCEKKHSLLTIGVTIEYGHPLTTWVVKHVEIANRQGKHFIEERIPIFSNNENCHIITPFNFHSFALTPYLPSKYKSIAHIPIMTQSSIPQI